MSRVPAENSGVFSSKLRPNLRSVTVDRNTLFAIHSLLISNIRNTE